MKPPDDRTTEELTVSRYVRASRRLILLDYDGTLVPFRNNPDLAVPDNDVLNILFQLYSDKQNTVAIISGRKKEQLERYLGNLPIILAAEHGLWIRDIDAKWKKTCEIETEWLAEAEKILWEAVSSAAGSFIERKSSSVAFHYRNCDPYTAESALIKIRRSIEERIHGEVAALDGNKVLEIKSTKIQKGLAVAYLMTRPPFDFILSCGDDTTDEDMFTALPENAITVKVGKGTTSAKNMLSSCSAVRHLLTAMTDAAEKEILSTGDTL